MKWIKQNAVAVLALFVALGLNPAVADGFGRGYQFALGLFGDGTSSAPSIAFINDTDTGIYRQGSGTMGHVTNGTERMRVTTSGVSIAANGASLGPGLPFSVRYAGSADVARFMDSTGNIGMYFTFAGGETELVGYNGSALNSLSFRATGTPGGQFKLNTDGTLRIGGRTTYAGGDGVGGGTPLLGTNFPGTVTTAPFTWLTMAASDGTVIYVPAWK